MAKYKLFLRMFAELDRCDDYVFCEGVCGEEA